MLHIPFSERPSYIKKPTMQKLFDWRNFRYALYEKQQKVKEYLEERRQMRKTLRKMKRALCIKKRLKHLEIQIKSLQVGEIGDKNISDVGKCSEKKLFYNKMPNLRFLPPPKTLTLAELAKICDAKLSDEKHAGVEISGVNTLALAGSGELSFLTNTKYKSEFAQTKAEACIVAENALEFAPANKPLLISENPHASYALAAAAIFEGYDEDESAEELISSEAKIGKDCKIAKYAEIGPGAEIGDNVVIHNFVRIGKNVKIGAGSVIKSNVVITHSVLGENCVIHPGVKLGQDGFGFAPSAKGVLKVPQLGAVVLGKNVELGANTTIDRGALEDTYVGDNTKIDNQVQLGHNVKVGSHCFFAAQVGIAGSTEVGDQVMMGGQAGTNGHIKIGAKSQIAGKTGVLSDLEEGAVVAGMPAMHMRTWFKMMAKMKQLVEKRANKNG